MKNVSFPSWGRFNPLWASDLRMQCTAYCKAPPNAVAVMVMPGELWMESKGFFKNFYCKTQTGSSQQRFKVDTSSRSSHPRCWKLSNIHFVDQLMRCTTLSCSLFIHQSEITGRRVWSAQLDCLSLSLRKQPDCGEEDALLDKVSELLSRPAHHKDLRIVFF